MISAEKKPSPASACHRRKTEAMDYIWHTEIFIIIYIKVGEIDKAYYNNKSIAEE